MSEYDHGSLSTYNNYGCRCDECIEAKKLYQREYMARKPLQVVKHRIRERRRRTTRGY